MGCERGPGRRRLRTSEEASVRAEPEQGRELQSVTPGGLMGCSRLKARLPSTSFCTPRITKREAGAGAGREARLKTFKIGRFYMKFLIPPPLLFEDGATPGLQGRQVNTQALQNSCPNSHTDSASSRCFRTHTHTGKATQRHGQKTTLSKQEKRPSEETKPADTLISDV